MFRETGEAIYQLYGMYIFEIGSVSLKFNRVYVEFSKNKLKIESTSFICSAIKYSEPFAFIKRK